LSTQGLTAEQLLDKMLVNNPGNYRRKKAVAVDMTEFESLRRQLVQHHADQVAELDKKPQVFQIGATKEDIGKAFHMHKLRGMIILDRNKVN